MSCEWLSDRLPAAYIPQPEGHVITPRGEDSAIRIEGHACNIAALVCQRAMCPSFDQSLEHYGVRVGIVFEGFSKRPPAGQIPQLHTIEPTCSQHLPV